MNDFIFDVNFPFYDLAAEANSALRGESDTEIPGVIEEIAEKDHCRISKITIVDDIGAAAMKRPKGNYITVEADAPEDKITQTAIVETLRDILIPMLPHNTESPILLCGIGNPDIASDSLGEETISRIIPTRHLENDTSHEIREMRPVALFAPNVLGNTGMEAAELVQAVTKQISPCAVIVIDALATASWERLGTSFQITDTGLAPGGGIGNTRPTINETACGVPVIALGVPTVIYPHAIITEILTRMREKEPALISFVKSNKILNEVMTEKLLTCAVTPKDIDASVHTLASILAAAIEGALHGSNTDRSYLPI